MGRRDDVSMGFASSSTVTRCRLSPKVLSKVSVNKLNIVPQRFVLERCQGATTGKINKLNKLITVNKFKVSWKRIPLKTPSTV